MNEIEARLGHALRTAAADLAPPPGIAAVAADRARRIRSRRHAAGGALGAAAVATAVVVPARPGAPDAHRLAPVPSATATATATPPATRAPAELTVLVRQRSGRCPEPPVPPGPPRPTWPRSADVRNDFCAGVTILRDGRPYPPDTFYGGISVNFRRPPSAGVRRPVRAIVRFTDGTSRQVRMERRGGRTWDTWSARFRERPGADVDYVLVVDDNGDEYFRLTQGAPQWPPRLGAPGPSPDGAAPATRRGTPPRR